MMRRSLGRGLYPIITAAAAYHGPTQTPLPVGGRTGLLPHPSRSGCTSSSGAAVSAPPPPTITRVQLQPPPQWFPSQRQFPQPPSPMFPCVISAKTSDGSMFRGLQCYNRVSSGGEFNTLVTQHPSIATMASSN
ncbi:hypothetical protein Pelo_8505 [Pelomyxa schiedti]|nr:hypothetical protein Pelo_8505 [Pelomyxa schiedti]